MFNPHEAREDFFGLMVALSFLFCLLVLYVAWTVAPSGTKYWVLSFDGQKVVAEITDSKTVKPSDDKLLGEVLLRNTDLTKNHLLVTYTFLSPAGDRHSGSAYLPAGTSVSGANGLDILVWRRNPNVSLPLSVYQSFRLDGRILAFALAIMAALAAFAFLTLLRWRRFRRLKSAY